MLLTRVLHRTNRPRFHRDSDCFHQTHTHTRAHTQRNCRFVGQVRCEDRCCTSWRLVNYITEMCLDNTFKTMTGVIKFHIQSDCTAVMAHLNMLRQHWLISVQELMSSFCKSASTQSQCSDSLSISDRFHLVFKCLLLEK